MMPQGDGAVGIHVVKSKASSISTSTPPSYATMLTTDTMTMLQITS